MTIRLSYRGACLLMALSMVAGACAFDIGRNLLRPVVMHVEYRRIPWDLADPFERCLAAVESAELPGWMWECRERPEEVK